MTHPLFRSEMFVETAFEKRFQAMLRSAWHKRSWHLIVADPGSGKTMGIRDLLKTAGGRSVLAVVAPKNNDNEQALGDQIFTALGLPLRGHWSTRKPKLMGHLHQYGTECLIVDDAHDLSLEHLMFIKEVTDQGRLQYDHPLGLCLVAAGRGDTIPLSASPKCTFSRTVVAIDLKRFTASSVTSVECPDCGRTRSLSPVKGVLRFPPHDRRKMQTSVTGKRWSAKGKTDWDVVGG